MSLPRFASNVAVALALAIGLAFVLGGNASACWIAARLTPWLLTLGLMMGFGGFVYWAFSQFKSTPALLVFLAGVLIPQLPGLILHYGGMQCGAL